MGRWRVGFLALVVAMAGWAWSPERWFDKPLSARVANYQIQAVLDWPGKVLDGHLTVAWRNTGTAPTQEIPFHLYLNAFKGPQSLFLREGGASPTASERDWGYCWLKSVEVDGQRLDGRVGEDETVHWVRLPRPVKPGETIQATLAWQAKFPRVQSRAGWGGDLDAGVDWSGLCLSDLSCLTAGLDVAGGGVGAGVTAAFWA